MFLPSGQPITIGYIPHASLHDLQQRISDDFERLQRQPFTVRLRCAGAGGGVGQRPRAPRRPRRPPRPHVEAVAARGHVLRITHITKQDNNVIQSHLAVISRII